MTITQEQLNNVYWERNQLVAYLTHTHAAYIYSENNKEIKWEGSYFLVFIILPEGQASWHVHKDELKYFAHLSLLNLPWDGHTTEQKYKRMRAYEV